jgi:hypothetical protein
LISTNVSPRALQPPGVASADGTNALYETMTVPLGPMVDLVPFIEQDGYTIRLNAIPSIIEFLGYDEPTNSVTAYIDGKEQTVFVPRPHFLVRQMAGEAAVRDGQTVMLASPPGAQGNSAAASVLEKKRLLVFVTPTLVDSAGNRVHPDAGSSR